MKEVFVLERLIGRLPGKGDLAAARLLRRLDGRLAASMDRQLRRKGYLRGRRIAPEASLACATEVLALRRRLSVAARVADGAKLREALAKFQSDLLDRLRDGSHSDPSACRREVIDAVSVLDAAIAALPDAGGVLFVPGELLAGLARQLLPPERMAVATGTEVDGGLRLTGFTDVTDEAKAGIAHVTADPAKLGAALQRMDLESARLAAWFHSHPGSGPGATLPSGTDRRQYADWSRDFDALVAGIVTADGHVRFWGDAVEGAGWTVRVTGTEVERIDARLFRIS